MTWGRISRQGPLDTGLVCWSTSPSICRPPGLGAVTAVEAVESAGTPDSYALGAAYPNPFNPETAIDFAVPAYGHVRIDVYNAAGQVVNSLVDRELGAGSYKATWDALDRYGEQVSSGVYFYRMVAGDFSATHSMTLLK